MAIMDSKLIFSEDQALTTTGSANSTNIVDLGAGYDAFGSAASANPGQAAKPLWLNVRVGTAFASAGSATLTVALQHCATVGGTYTQANIATPAIGKASLVAGYNILSVPLPVNLNRYLKLVYTVGTADMTAGTVNAWIGMDSESDK